MTKPQKPLRLKPDATIGVIGLASPSDKERIDRAIARLKSEGFKVKVALDPSREYGSKDHLFISEDNRLVANALVDLFEDPSVDAILSARGGYGSMRLLEHLDFKRIAKCPKLFCGFSDLTALLVAIYQQAGIVTLHSAGLESGFNKAAPSPETAQSARSLLEVLSGQSRAGIDHSKLTLLQGQRDAVEGPMVGGNLTVLSSLCGTPWQACFDDHIVFLEEVGEAPYRIHRSLLQLKLAGSFHKVKAVVLGSFRNCVHKNGEGPTVDRVIEQSFSDAKFPVYSGGKFGHDELNLAIPLGIPAKICDNVLEFTENTVLK